MSAFGARGRSNQPRSLHMVVLVCVQGGVAFRMPHIFSTSFYHIPRLRFCRAMFHLYHSRGFSMFRLPVPFSVWGVGGLTVLGQLL